MATFKSFEEIDAWKKARELTRRVYRYLEKARSLEILGYGIKYVGRLSP